MVFTPSCLRKAEGRSRRKGKLKPIPDMFDGEWIPEEVAGSRGLNRRELNIVEKEVAKFQEDREERCEECGGKTYQDESILMYGEFKEYPRRICSECRRDGKGSRIEFIRPLPRRRKKK
jgi:hypothetical protein